MVDELHGEHQADVVAALKSLRQRIVDSQAANVADWPGEIAGFRIVDELAWSGQAASLLAFDVRLKRNVVLKLYHGTPSEELRERILAEGQNLAKVSSPNVAKCYGVGEYEGYPYLILEHVEGVPLEHASFDEADIRLIFSQICQGVGDLHEAGLVHGDIKPTNVMVDREGSARLIDLGSSLDAGTADEQSPATIGYLPPEAARREPHVDRRRADVFSLGGVLYFMLTGKAPFQSNADGEAIDHSKANRFEDITTASDQQLVDLSKRCMATDPRDRFKDANDLHSTLNKKPSLASANQEMAKWAVNGVLAAVVGLLLLAVPWSPRVGEDAAQSPMADDERSDQTSITKAPSKITSSNEMLGATTAAIESLVDGKVGSKIRLDVTLIADGAESPVADLPTNAAGAIRLPAGEGRAFSVSAPVECWVGLVSFDRENDVLVPYVLGPTLHVLPNRSTRTASGIAFFESDGEHEFLCVVAATKEWDADDLTSAIKSRKVFRGMRMNAACSVKAIEYVVEDQTSTGALGGARSTNQVAVIPTMFKPARTSRQQERLRDLIGQALAAVDKNDMDGASELLSQIQSQLDENTDKLIVADAKYVQQLLDVSQEIRRKCREADPHVAGSVPLEVLEKDYEFLKAHPEICKKRTAEKLFYIGRQRLKQSGQDLRVKEQAVGEMIEGIEQLRRAVGKHPYVVQVAQRATLPVVASRDLGAVRMATKYQQVAVETFGTETIQHAEAMVCVSAALTRSYDYVPALDIARQSIRVFESKSGGRRSFFYGLAKLTVGQLAQLHQDYDRAAESFADAAEAFIAIGNGTAMEAIAMKADAQFWLGQLDGSEATVAEAEKLARKYNLPENETISFLIVKAAVAAAQGDHNAACPQLEELVAKSRSLGHFGYLETALRHYGNALLHAPDEKRQRKSIEVFRALMDSKSKRGLKFYGNENALKGLAHELVEDLQQARTEYEKGYQAGVRAADGFRSRQSAIERFLLVERSLNRNLHGLIRTCVDADSVYRGFVWDAKGRVGTELSTFYRLFRATSAVATELRRVRRERQAWLYGGSEEGATNFFELERQKEALEKRLIGEQQVSSEQVESISALSRLPSDTAIVDIVRLGPTVASVEEFAFFIISNIEGEPRIELIRLEAGQLDKKVEPVVGQLARGMRMNKTKVKRKAAIELALNECSKVLAPVFARLPKTATKLVICPDRGLHGLAWAALRDQETSISQKYSIVYSESARQFLSSQGEARKRGRDTLLVVGDLDFADKERPLPKSADEVSALSQLYGASAEVLTGSEATTDQVRKAAQGKAILHFATHARWGIPDGGLIKRSPLLSSVLAVSGGEIVSGDQIAAWDLSGVELVLLSACEGSVGTEMSGEGSLSLERAYRIAGARCVIANQWRVEDNAAKDFMLDVHKNLKRGLSPVESVAVTQRAWELARRPIKDWSGWRVSR